jgi:prepilin-type N-terminal cleavage/methylation domain-containing protein
MKYFRKNGGFTLIELLIVLVLSSILMAGLYRTFIGQQKTYTVQDQVADMQQNVRVAIDKMTREIRMAGYGGGTNILSVFNSSTNYVNNFSQIITLGDNVNNVGTNDDRITVILADQVGVLTSNALKTSTTLLFNGADQLFNTTTKKYLNLNGQNNYVVSGVSSSSITVAPLSEDHLANEPVYLVKAITYELGTVDGKPTLRRNENTGGGLQSLAESIENLQFVYYDSNGIVTATPADIRMIKVTVRAKTDRSDPDFKGGDGFRRRELASFVKVRNMGL